MRQSSKTLNRIYLYRLPVIVLCLFIFWQSSYPSLVSTSLFAHDDKVFHFATWALLAFLSARSLCAEKPFWSAGRIKRVVIVFACLYGLSDELHQAFVSSRSASAADFLADCAGSILGCFFYLKVFMHKKTERLGSNA